MNGLGKTTKVVDQGDLYGNPIVDETIEDKLRKSGM